MSDAAIGGITTYQIQNISLTTFKSIRNFGALNQNALAAATFQQLMAIPNWPNMPSSLILAAFASPSGADLANSVTDEQMVFDPDNVTYVNNIVAVKGIISSDGLGWDVLHNDYASQNPQLWNWIHVATVTTIQVDNFWTTKNNILKTQAWAGLQASQTLQPALLEAFSIDVLHSLMPDTFAFDTTQPASVILAVRIVPILSKLNISVSRRVRPYTSLLPSSFPLQRCRISTWVSIRTSNQMLCNILMSHMSAPSVLSSCRRSLAHNSLGSSGLSSDNAIRLSFQHL